MAQLLLFINSCFIQDKIGTSSDPPTASHTCFSFPLSIFTKNCTLANFPPPPKEITKEKTHTYFLKKITLLHYFCYIIYVYANRHNHFRLIGHKTYIYVYYLLVKWHSFGYIRLLLRYENIQYFRDIFEIV